MKNKSNNRIVWITGASSGIGKSTVNEFLSNGINIAASSRKPEVLNKNIDPKFRNLIAFHPLDVSDYKQTQEVYNSIAADSRVECLINNAGITTFSEAKEDSFEVIREIINVNLLGAINTIKAVIPEMINSKNGLIINILSVAARKIFNRSSAYAASKAGLLAYSNVLREELREYNIRVVNILPGATKTPIWHSSVLEKYSNRMMSPDDIAKLVFNIYSQKSNAVWEEVVLRPVKGDL